MQIEITISIITAIIVGLIQIIKGLGINKKWSPIIAIILGVIFVGIMGYNWSHILFMGIIAGLSAVGLYSGAKNTKEGIKGK